MHTAMVVLVAGFAGFDWWQWQRALEGNLRSWAYAFLWPMFAGFVIYMWIREIRDELEASAGEQTEGEQAGTSRAGSATAGRAKRDRLPPHVIMPARTMAAVRAERIRADEQDDEELAAYNRYLAELNARSTGGTGEHPEVRT